MMIPRILHQIWVGGPVPHRFSDYMRSWTKHHPQWEYVLWTDRNLPELRNRSTYDRAHTIVPRDAVGQFRADILRYEILHRYGGLYADMDTMALRPVDEAIGDHRAFAAAEDENWVGNTYLACVPGHPVMAELISGIPASVRRNRRRRPNRITGPRYLTPIWQRYNCYVAPREHWYPFSYSDVKNSAVPSEYGDAYAMHSWDHTRRVMEARR